MAIVLLYYCTTALLYHTGDWQQLETGHQFIAIVLVYYYKITLLDHTEDSTQLQLDIHSSLLYYCTTDYYCTQARPLALRELCVTIAWALREAALGFAGGSPWIFEIVLLWFISLTLFYYGFPKLYNGYHDDIWLRLLLTSISFVKLNTMGIKELMIATASLD